MQGSGIEIGAGSDPFPIPSGVGIKYVDCITPADLIKIYPEYSRIRFVNVDFLAQADELPFTTASQNFVINAHLLEHLVNPLKAVKEWHRVLTKGGILYSIIPDKVFTYDKERPCTTLEHVVHDYHRPSVRKDIEHLKEYFQLVEKIKDQDAIKKRVRETIKNKDPMIHYHVWDYKGIKDFFHYVSTWLGMDIKLMTSDKNFEAIIVLQK